MRPVTKLHPYQLRAINHLVQHPHAMLHLDMGLGKTVITLTAFEWLRQFSVVRSMLVVAPLRPGRIVWEKEAIAWEHTQGLTFSYVMGTAQQRINALFRPADVYVINYENLAWLRVQLEGYFLGRGEYPPFQMIVWDEITKMKNASTLRVKEFTDVMPYIARRVGLTGTPASNGLVDLHGQYLMVDDGLRLGVSPGSFKKTYFYSDPYSRRAEPYSGTPERLAELVSDITMQMRAADYIDMPQLLINDVWVDLPPGARRVYDEVEDEFFAELDSGLEITVVNEASKVNKLLQIADGMVYLVPGQPAYEQIHTAKLEAWMEIRDQIGDAPLLSAYRYKFMVPELQRHVPDLVNLSGTTAKQSEEIEAQFNLGLIKNLISHPGSAGHGLNLQQACHHVAMIGCVWSLDLNSQMIARVCRQGQRRSHVVLHRILARNTFDEIVIDRLASNDESQESLRSAINRYRQKRRLAA